MSSKLLDTKVNTSFSTESRTGNKKPPANATITSKEVRTSVEQIENGFILSKSYDVRYKANGKEEYTYYTEKYYSKTNPITIKINSKALADDFAE